MRKIGVGTFTATEKMREAINDVLDTGRISYGPYSRKFEQRFAEIHQRKFGVLSNSGTSSLQVALQAMKELHGWQDGDEIIVPACTFVATVNIVLHNRLKPVLVDIEPEYFGIDCNRISREITNKTRCMIPVHLFGMPCNMANAALIARPNLSIIEDSCECMFVRHGHRMVGNLWSNIACFSTYVAHLLTTGVGGISITDNPDLAAKMRSLVNHGRDGIYLNIDDNNVDGAELHEVISRRFNFESVGHSFRITELESALAVAQLDDWPQMIKKRQVNAKMLTDGLQYLEERELLQLPKLRPATESANMMYPILALNQDKWSLCNYLESHGIETRELLRLTDQPVYAKLGLWNPDDYPVATKINREGYYIPCHQDLTMDDIAYIIQVHYDYFDSISNLSYRSMR